MADKAFKPSEVQPEGEERTNKEVREKESREQVVETPEDVSRPEPVPEDGRHRPEPEMERRCACIRQPSTRMMESLENQQPRGQKHRPEGEDGEGDRPAQCLRANLARLAVATEMLIGDSEYNVNEGTRTMREKAGVWIPKTYGEAVNDPIYGSRWKEAIHKELSALMNCGTWNVIP